MSESPGQDRQLDKIPELLDELGNSSGTIRQAARNRLAAIGTPAVPALIKALLDCNDLVRWGIVKVLGKIQDPTAAPALAKQLEDKSVDVRWAAAASLIQYRQAAVAPVLSLLVRDFHYAWLREGARYVLRQLNKDGYLDPAVGKVVEALDGPAPEVETAWLAKSALEKIEPDWEKNAPGQPVDQTLEMEIFLGSDVICADHPCGKIVGVVLNASHEIVTELIVKEQGHKGAEYLVPVDEITGSSQRILTIVSTTLSRRDAQPYRTKKQIQAGELTVDHNQRIIARDGVVGSLDGFVINPDNGRIAHIILREKHLWSQGDISIPADKIEHIEAGAIYLSIEKCTIDTLPSIAIQG